MNAMRERISVDLLTLSLSYTCLRAPVCGYACAYIHDTSPVFIQNKTTVLIHYEYAWIYVHTHTHASVCIHFAS